MVYEDDYEGDSMQIQYEALISRLKIYPNLKFLEIGSGDKI